MGSGWRWVARGWLGVWWMKEGGQAERSTRGGLRGTRAARGEKLEKGRFKYQAPRGGPRSLSHSLSLPFSVALLTLSILFLSSLRFFSFSLLSFPHYHPPPFAVLRLCTHTAVSRTYIHRHVHSRTHVYRSSAREKAS